ncbi:MAG: PKD domain-containing protein [Flavobacteriales bacterium]|nr:PKD domain-containing protein [Flavobacteriales bacterium]
MSFERAAGDCDGEKTQPCLPDNFDGSWVTCNYPGGGPATSDIQPGQYGFVEPPTDGNTYMSFWASGSSGTGESNGERTSLQLCNPLQAGTQYCFTLDYVRPAGGFNAPTVLLIEGGMSACSSDEILFQSAEITSPAPGTWGTWSFCFTPGANYTYLRFRAVDGPSGGFGGYLGIDNWVSTDGKFPPTVGGGGLTVIATPDTSICLGESVTLQVTPGGGITPYSFAWTPATDLSDPNIANPVATPGTTTTYVVMVTDSAGCTGTDSITVTVDPIPVVLVAPDSTCAGSCVTLSASGADSYTWVPATGLNNPNSATPQACPTSTTTYTVTGTTTGGCEHDTTVTVTIFQPPVADAGPDLSYCQGDSAQLNGSVSGGQPSYTYFWSPSTGLSNPQIANPVTATTTTTTYYLTVTDARGCTGLDSVIVTVQPGPCHISALLQANPSEICEGSCTDLTATPSGGTAPFSYTWDQGITGNEGPHQVCPTTTTSYSVTITDDNGDSAFASVTVTVNPPPTTTTNSTDANCGSADGTTTVTAGGTGPYTYLWSPGGYTSSGVTGVTAGSYHVTVTDANGCVSEDSVNILNIGGPTACFMADTLSGCAPLDVLFSSCSTNEVSYLWNFGDMGPTDTSANPTHPFNSPGCYDITLVVTSANGCEDTLKKDCYIEVYDNPNANFTASSNDVDDFNPVINFTDLSTDAFVWIWNFGDNGTSDFQNPTHIYTDTGTYVVSLAVENGYGCKDTVSTTVRVHEDPTFYVPDAFTPNNDGMNDYFQPYGEMMDFTRLEMYIFDRWGNLIYTGTNWQGWDGCANEGTDISQEDVYVWKIRAWTYNGEEINRIGRVTLIK